MWLKKLPLLLKQSSGPYFEIDNQQAASLSVWSDRLRRRSRIQTSISASWRRYIDLGSAECNHDTE
uniref:Uncharacterized protein n=1 Tax=Anguilla anguilla TaxID=7936 RepID=A0A0E9VFJ3_ANGAN